MMRISQPKKSAAGLPAVISTAKHVWRHLGPVRGSRLLARMNQKGGFDCPGCAWPDPDDRRAMVEFCENGAKALADEAMRKTIDRKFFRQHSLPSLLQQSEFWLGQQGRLVEPLVRRRGADHYEPIPWPEALGLIAQKLQGLGNPNAAAFYTSGRTSNEAAFLYQLFVRMYGTNNLPDCSNLCHESSGSALNQVLGTGKGTVTLEDIHQAKAIFVVGQNPGTNHPRMLTALEKAKANGATVVCINPLRDAGLNRFKNPQRVSGMIGPGTSIADLFLPVRINGDVAAFKGIMKCMDERQQAGESIFDQSFIAQHTAGFDDFLNALRQTGWPEICEASGLSIEQIKAAADVACRAESIIVCWAMGLTQHKNAVANIREIVNFLLLRGNVGRPGAGACPVRGHSNVQGDRTMGIWEKPSHDFLQRLQRTFGFEPPREHGHDVVGTIRAMLAGEVRALFALGGNFLSASPDTAATERALKNCELTVHVATKLNRSHLVTGSEALLLPCLGRSERDLQGEREQFVTVENSMGIVHSSRGTLRPASNELRSEVWIIAHLAKLVVGDRSSRFDWLDVVEDYDRIRNLIAETIPGFEDFNQRIRASAQGFYLPNPVRDERRFPTKNGRANFSLNPIGRIPLAADQLLMMTIRTHDQYNTTIYGMDDRYRGIYGTRRVLLINRRDMQRRQLRAGDLVDLESEYSGQIRRAEGFTVVEYEIPDDCAATYFPEANPLVPLEETAEISGTPISKSVVIRAVKSPLRSRPLE
jgi:molybdopterin-dependent oxidoreductase alpha subunit